MENTAKNKLQNLQQNAQMFVSLPHNAQPGKGSVGHWMESSRTFRPCMMCSGIQEPREVRGETGLWCPTCQFFTATEEGK